MSVVFALVNACLVLVGIAWFYKIWKTRKLLRGMPGPTGYPLFGSVIDLLVRNEENIFKYGRELASKYPSIYQWWLGPIPSVNILNPQDVEIIASSTKHISKGSVYDAFHIWLGTGLLTSEGSKWHSRRKILTPTFHFSILQQFLGIFAEQTERLVEKLEEECGKSYTYVDDYITNFTLNSICETAMGTFLDKKDSKQESYRKSIFKMGEIIIYRSSRPWFFSELVFMLSPKYWKQKALSETLHEFSRCIIEKRREAFKKTGSYSQNKRLAMLDLLLTAKENGADLDDEGIREEVDTFMFEGHDTTATSLCFTLMIIACNQEAQEKIIKELDEVFGDSQRKPSSEDLQQLSYLEMCIKESLRLYPSVPYIARKTSQEVKTHQGYTIPANCLTPIHIYDIHRIPEIYPNPEEFDPERFSVENSKNRHPYAYLPFSAGPRNCIGQRFAMLELKTVLSGILRKYKLEQVDTPSSIQLKADIVLRATKKIRVKFVMRN